jgi:ATP synthase F1 gamma subunit
MITRKQIKSEVEMISALKSLVEVYEEVAASRMQKVRGAVIQSRYFLDGLLDVFGKIKNSYTGQLKTGGIRARNGRTVAVFVSANAGLYGDIVERIFMMFSDYVQREKSDAVVMGKLGVKLMTEKLPRVLYNYYDFSDDEIDQESLQMVMRYLVQYEKVLVFYGKFRTILNQDPVVTSVTGDALVAQESRKTVTAEVKYLFEPSVGEVARIFEGEILASIFEQTLHESQLAKFASRLMALDASVDKIDDRWKDIGKESRRVKRREINKKQLSTISGISLWQHGR